MSILHLDPIYIFIVILSISTSSFLEFAYSYVWKYAGQQARPLATKRSADVTPEMNLRNILDALTNLALKSRADVTRRPKQCYQ